MGSTDVPADPRTRGWGTPSKQGDKRLSDVFLNRKLFSLSLREKSKKFFSGVEFSGVIPALSPYISKHFPGWKISFLSPSLKEPPGLQSLPSQSLPRVSPFPLKAPFPCKHLQKALPKKPCSLQSCSEVPVPPHIPAVPEHFWPDLFISPRPGSPSSSGFPGWEVEKGGKRWKTAGAADSAPAGSRGQGKLHEMKNKVGLGLHPRGTGNISCVSNREHME